MMNNVEKIKILLPLWYAQRVWAEELLVKSLKLSKAEDVLQHKYRGTNQIPGTNWMYRTHGIGVDIYRTVEVGGIDFDFNKVAPDEWRLKIFFEKQYNEGNLPLDEYRDLAEDEDLLESASKEALDYA